MMRTLCIKISDHLYELLAEKAQKYQLKLSDVGRECLLTGVKKFRVEPTSEKTISTFEKCLAVFPLLTHCLLENFVKQTAQNGIAICDTAEAKAEEIFNTVFKKTSGEGD